MAEFPEIVTDESDGEHRLTELLGRGGQGGVYRTANPEIAVKLVEPGHETRDELRRKLTRVRMLRGVVPALADLPVARPLDMLREPHLGYVMKVLTGMKSIAHLMNPPPEIEGDAVPGWFLAGGGLRRRLRLLAKVAEVISGLHAYSLVYVDTSDNNIFVSTDVQATEAWLIDADNLAFESRPGDNQLSTPWFTAPEVIQGKSGANTLTDAHAFAVLAFMTLTLAHPLLGDKVIQGPASLEDKAFAGRFPWIDHPDDRRNARTIDCFSRKEMLTNRLQDLAHRCFGPGLNDPVLRPGVTDWAEALNNAADATIRCSRCEATYYPRLIACPWCRALRPAFTLIAIRRWGPKDGDFPGGLLPKGEATLGLTISRESPRLELTARTTRAKVGIEGRTPCLGLSLDESGIKVEILDGGKSRYLLSENGRAARLLGSGERIPVGSAANPWMIHFGPLDQPHRVAVFEPKPGALR